MKTTLRLSFLVAVLVLGLGFARTSAAAPDFGGKRYYWVSESPCKLLPNGNRLFEGSLIRAQKLSIPITNDKIYVSNTVLEWVTENGGRMSMTALYRLDRRCLVADPRLTRRWQIHRDYLCCPRVIYSVWEFVERAADSRNSPAVTLAIVKDMERLGLIKPDEYHLPRPRLIEVIDRYTAMAIRVRKSA